MNLNESRRDFLKTTAVAGGVVASSALLGSSLMAQGKTSSREGKNGSKTGSKDEDGKGVTTAKCKHVIMLYMAGGPSQMETFDPKPGAKNGGPTKAIETEVPGFTPSENLPEIAKHAGDLCLIKSMTTKEGNHSRGSYLMHTGYGPNATIKHPSLGSIVSHELGNPDFELPNYIRLRGGPFSSGYLGVDHNPFVITAPGQAINNLEYAKNVDQKRMDRRMKLVSALDKGFAKDHGEEASEAHKTQYEKAIKLMNSPLREKFSLKGIDTETRKMYGEGAFADSCIIASRLVEAGVASIEITQGGWDTHGDNFNRCKDLCTAIDKPWAALIDDLKRKGLFEETLIVWMGEFGRTPRINNTDGRDHWPGNFCVVLGGGGVTGGQVIGETDEEGTQIAADPIGPAELYATMAELGGWNYTKEYEAGNRPVWLVMKGAKPISKVYS